MVANRFSPGIQRRPARSCAGARRNSGVVTVPFTVPVGPHKKEKIA
jgi:hypothetical protein